MTIPAKALPLIMLVAAVSGCVAGGNDRVDTLGEIEDTTGNDVDGDGTVIDNGLETPD